MVTSIRSIPKRPPTPSDRPPMQKQRSFSTDSSSNNSKRNLRRCSSGLSHGLQMDLKQAVQLEKQELKKMGLFPPSIAVQPPLPKTVEPEDDDDDKSCFSSSYWLYRQQRTVRRAASFTSGPMPCSPPVPIPQQEAQRRYSAAGGTGEEYMRYGELQHMSKSQCEARLWDEFWNYKLSFEARESFEAGQEEETARVRASSEHLMIKYRSESLMSSTADTVNEDEEEEDLNGPEDEDHVHHCGGVFKMDDL